MGMCARRQAGREGGGGSGEIIRVCVCFLLLPLTISPPFWLLEDSRACTDKLAHPAAKAHFYSTSHSPLHPSSLSLLQHPNHPLRPPLGELFSRAGLEKHLHLLASLLSFGLSLGIIAGSCLLKVPQLLNIVRSQVSREGGREEAMEAREALRERMGK